MFTLLVSSKEVRFVMVGTNMSRKSTIPEPCLLSSGAELGSTWDWHTKASSWCWAAAAGPLQLCDSEVCWSAWIEGIGCQVVPASSSWSLVNFDCDNWQGCLKEADSHIELPMSSISYVYLGTGIPFIKFSRYWYSRERLQVSHHLKPRCSWGLSQALHLWLLL